jgi:hypothetical protein
MFTPRAWTFHWLGAKSIVIFVALWLGAWSASAASVPGKPYIVSVSPPEGTYSQLTRLTFTFNEDITQVWHNYLRINDNGSQSKITVSNNVIVLNIPQPPYGLVKVEVVSVKDFDYPPQTMDPATFYYSLVDTTAPVVTNVFPSPGATVRNLGQVEIAFSEPVKGVDAADLRVNNQPATNVSIRPGGFCIFQFLPPTSNGPVQIRWNTPHGITDYAATPNAFATPLAWTNTLNTNLSRGDVVITEICAANRTGLQDEAGLAADWIELKNQGGTGVNLDGWSLSNDPDNPGKWIFPSRVINPGEYLVVFASAKDIHNPSGTNKLHLNFPLAAGGEFLGLYAPDSPRVLVSSFSPAFPEQHNDYSYGLDANGQWRYFASPTPGKANPPGLITNLCQPVHFSVARGFFTKPFDLMLSCATPGVTIRYTTDGTEPNENTGTIYRSALKLANTTMLRAAAFRTNLVPSVACSQSYFFNLGTNLTSLLVLSIVTAANNLIGPLGINSINGGDYLTNGGPWVSLTTNDYNNNMNHGREWERPASAELILPDGDGGFAINCGLRVQGSEFTRQRYLSNAKFSYRLYFRGDYGETKLRYHFFPRSTVEEFDVVSLRAGHNDMTNPFIRDELFRRLYQDMGNTAAQGTFVNLFINGVYKGYYNPCERISEDSFDVWEGQSDWDHLTIISTVQAGDRAVWDELCNYYNSGQDPNIQAVYRGVASRLDITNFVDFLTLWIYSGGADWPHNNWHAARPRTTNGVFQFHAWDAESGFTASTSVDVFGIDRSGMQGPSEIASLYRFLWPSTEFRLIFADRIQKHFFNGGALTGANITNRFEEMRKELLGVIPSMNRNILTNWVPNRITPLFDQFYANDLYNNYAPGFSQQGGRVAPGFALTMTAPYGGTIYYTTNDADPRVMFSGNVSPSARAYANNAKPVFQITTVVKARVRNAGVWSPLVEAVFEVASLTCPLRITEINYNPPEGNAYEFIELFNAGPVVLDLGGWKIEDAIDFLFPDGAVLGAGNRLLLANNANPGAFTNRYPGVSVYGWFGGNLANSGERIVIRDNTNNVALTVTYDDEGGWPVSPDGSGPTLEVLDPMGNLSDPANWVASSMNYGTPGIVTTPSLSVVRFNEIMADNRTAVNFSGTYPDWVELYNASTNAVTLEGWGLSDDGNPFKFVFPSNTLIYPSNYLLLWCDTNLAAPGLHTGFALDRDGSRLFLCNVTGVRQDAMTFGQQLPDYSLGLVSNTWILTSPTTNAANVAASLGNVTNVVINEWLANALPGGGDWVELFNRSALPVSLQGMYFGTSNAVQQISWPSFVPPYGFAMLYPDEKTAPNHLPFNLPASAGAVVLYDAAAIQVNKFTYTNASEGVSRGRLPDGATMITNFVGTTSPGNSNYVNTYTGPYLNEVLARNVSAVTNLGHTHDYVELYNPALTNWNLSGMSLGIDSQEPGKFVFPPNTVMPPKSYLVIWCDADQPLSTNAGDFNTGRDLDGESGGVYLFNAMQQWIDAIEFGPQIPDKPLGVVGGQWRLLVAPTPGQSNAAPQTLGNDLGLRLNEWMANPVSGPDWFELFNASSLPVDLSGLYLSDDPSSAGLTKHQIPRLSFIGASNWTCFVADNNQSQGQNHVSFNLDGRGETLLLVRTNGTNFISLDIVPFGVQSPGISQGRLPDGGTNMCSFAGSASPGEANYLLVPGVIISEILPRPNMSDQRAIEVQNTGTSKANLAGWFISDSQNDFRKWRIPDGTMVDAGAFVVFRESQFTNAQPIGFQLDARRGGEVWLSATDADGNLTGWRTRATYRPAAVGISQGRYTTRAGMVDYVEQSVASLGGSNAPPLVGPIIIHEIMYHAPAPTNSAIADEYLELHNFSAVPVPLYDPARPTNTFCVRGGVGFDFPGGVELSAGGYLLLVNFDPANVVLLNAFRARYGILPTVPVWGPFNGRLGNDGDRVELLRPELPLDGFLPYVRMDYVEYSDSIPWPEAADGFGPSLQRRAAGLFGNDPESWMAAAPAAGTPNSSGVSLPLITINPRNVTALEGSWANFGVAATGGDSPRFQWRFNGVEIGGETNAWLFMDYLVQEHEGHYDVLVCNSNGVTVSPAAQLNVLVPPVILIVPTSQLVPLGSNVTLAVSATGGSPLSYQWRKNGAMIADATNEFVVLSNFQLADEGWYEVTISNPDGTAVRSASVYAAVPPTITQQPLSQNAAPGERITLSVTVTGTRPCTYEWRLGTTPLWTNVSTLDQSFFSFTSPVFPTQQSYQVLVRNDVVPASVFSDTALVTVITDSDVDGMPDTWETMHGLNPNNAADRNLDSDNDGLSNYQEYLAGTNPTNILNALRANLRVESNHLAFSFEAATNRTFAVHYASLLNSTQWQILSNFCGRPSNRVESLFIEPAGQTNRLYRVTTPVAP